MSGDVALSALDLAPVSEGAGAGEALKASLDLAVGLDHWGYLRVWYAEHHFASGVASASPAVLAALAAERTRRIRVGSGAVLLGSTSPALGVEQFATIAQLHPGRVDLGLGRAALGPDSAPGLIGSGQGPGGAPPGDDRWVDGLLVPASAGFTLNDPEVRQRFLRHVDLVGQRAAIGDFVDELGVALGLLGDGVPGPDGIPVRSTVGHGSGVELFALASSGGASARAAGALGLPLAANYHVNPATILETVASYREAFRPGVLAEPYLIVSADALVADDEATARERAHGFEEWVLSIRAGGGAIPLPPPGPPASLTQQERALVHDRTATRFVGAPEQVADGLRTLAHVTGAQELLITTETFDPAHRARSYELLAQAWGLAGGDARADHGGQREFARS